MRVILCVHSLRAGGAERVIAWLAGVLAERGHDVTLVVRMPPETDFYPVDSRVEIVRIVRPSGGASNDSKLEKIAGLRRFMVGLRELAKSKRADVVLSFIDMNNLYTLSALVGTGIPVVVSERIHPDFHELGRLERLRPRLYRTAACVVVQTDDVEQIANEGWKVKRTVVIPNPVIGSETAIVPVDRRPKTVVSVGRLTPQKDHATLLEAWAVSRSAEAGWNLEIFGYGSQLDSLMRRVDALGVSESVDISEPIADIQTKLQSCRIFVLPSRYEGFPNALLEGLAAGCACIAADCPGASAAVLDGGKAGILFEPGDIDELAKVLAALRASDDDQARLSRAGMQRAKDFSESKIAERWESALMSAASFGSKHG